MRVLFDLETNGIDFSTGNWLPDIHTVFCLVTYNLDTNELNNFYGDNLEEGIALLEKADELVGHNIIQFDLPVLRKLYDFKFSGRVYDTLVASRTLHPDRANGHSLEAWGRRLGYPKGEFGDFTKFSREMLEYCERDVRLNVRVYQLLQAEQRNGEWEAAIELEHQVAEIIAEQERVGFQFDVELAERCIKEWTELLEKIDADIHSRIKRVVIAGPRVLKPFKINGELAKRPNDILRNVGIDPSSVGGPFSTFTYEYPDLNSKDKQKKLLLELGWKPEEFTETGGPKLGESIKKVGPVGELLFERNILTHRLSQVAGLLSNADDSNRVHGGANPCGTNTARMTHQRIVNIPKVKKPFGKELRSLFTVPEKKVLVGYDAKALELRILAHYIGNEEYNERVTTRDESRDAHVLAARAGGIDNRDTGKTINYALIFGARDGRLGSIIGGGKAAGAKLRRELYRNIPGLEQVVKRAEQAARRGYLIGLDGRKFFLRKGKSPLNVIIQGGGAIFMKTVSVCLDALVDKTKAFKVVDMHDEAQWECDEDYVPTLEAKIHEAFEQAGTILNLRCPQEADVKVGKNWAETH